MGNKQKSTFWSQLLLGMLAIFLLPAAQELSVPDSPQTGNYQQTAQTQSQEAVFHETAILTPAQPQSGTAAKKLSQNRPHFSGKTVVKNDPIRAGPAFSLV